MKNLIKLKQAVIVEGKYDKIRLSNFIDGVIITTDGFRIFKDKEKTALIRLLAEKQGLLILTDSDSAGQLIRKHVEKLAGKERVKNVYLPQILGKEKRKNTPSAEGFLGVEGIDDEIILEALGRVGVLGEKILKKGRGITKTDLFNMGISGRENSAEKRASFLRFLKLPQNLPVNSLLDLLNSLYGYEDFLNEVEKWNRECSENLKSFT